MKKLSLLAALALGVTASTQAAYIVIDDSDLNTITITAGDFENGFSVNGNPFAFGLGVSDSVTLPDGGYEFDGSWIDLGDSGAGATSDILFSESSDPTGITSGVAAVAASDGFFGSLTGSSFGGYAGFVYFNAGGAFDQNSGTQVGGLPFLSISFTPEATGTVPDGGNSMMLLGLTTCALGLIGRLIRR
ncbi:MAG: hypothetical protein ACKV19_08910 [Verrucomicrobiales bacterium]